LKAAPFERAMRPKEDLQHRMHAVYGIHGIVAIRQAFGLRRFVDLAFEVQPLDRKGMGVVPVVDERRSRGDASSERLKDDPHGRFFVLSIFSSSCPWGAFAGAADFSNAEAPQGSLGKRGSPRVWDYSISTPVCS